MDTGLLEPKSVAAFGRRWLLIGLLLVAWAMRVYHLDEIPPGPYHDEAYEGLDAISLVQGSTFPRFYEPWEQYTQEIRAVHPAHLSRWPVFFEGNWGREPLYTYLAGLAFAVLGPSTWALRLVSAFGGLLVIALVTALARALFQDHADVSRIGAMATAMAVGFYWLLTFSRIAVRPVWFLVIEGVTLLTFWQAWRKNRLPLWIVAGCALGVSQYTYSAARFFPFVLGFFVLTEALSDRPSVKRRWSGILGLGISALLVAAPLLLFYLEFPDILMLRSRVISSVEPGGGLETLGPNLVNAFLGLVWRGHSDPFLNLPGRPAFDPGQTVLFLIGVALVSARLARSVYRLLAWWLLVMLFPSLVVGTAPHFGRSIGVVWPIILIVALGANQVWRWLAMLRPRIATPLMGSVLLLSIVWTGRDYFVRYPQYPDLAWSLQAHLPIIGRLASSLPEDMAVYLTPPQWNHAAILFGELGELRLRDFYGPAGLVPLGQSGKPVAYIVIPREDQTTSALLEKLLPVGKWTRPADSFAVYTVPAKGRPAPGVALDANWGTVIQLMGADLPGGEALPGQALAIRLYWQALSPMQTRYTAFVHLLDSDGRLIAQHDKLPGVGTFGTERWLPGEMVTDQFELRLPTDLPPGEYQLLTGFYDSDSLARLPAFQHNIQQKHDLVALGVIRVESHP
jgi:4-amino-4-deoxy-L-arabinose transferase-like glycosyltransferase